MSSRHFPFQRLLLPALLLPTLARAVPPAAPVINFITWNDANQVNISWQDKSTDEAGFYIAYRTSPDATFNIWESRAANVTSVVNGAVNASLRVCGSVYEWTVISYKVTNGTPEYGFPPSGVKLMSLPPVGTTVCPPAFWVPASTIGNIGSPISAQATPYKRTAGTGAVIPVTSTVTATGLPAGLTVSSTGVISGSSTVPGKHVVTFTTQEAGGLLATRTAKITLFRPLPALVGPANGTPLPNRTLRRDAAATTVDLNTHFNDPDVTDATRLVFNTGTIDFLYYPTYAPATVANFKGYVSRGDFVNTIIHRSMPDFVLQGGGYKAAAGAPSIQRQNPVVNEPAISNVRGTVAMAKSASSPDSATSEYFISLDDNSSNLNLQNEGFTVFARVPAAGMLVADAIEALPIRNYSSTYSALANCPVTNPPPAAFDPASLVKLLSAGPVAPLSYSALSSAPAVCSVSVNNAQLSLTPLTAGAATVTVTARDLDDQSIGGTFNIVVEEHLSDWLTAQNFPNGADAAATADSDHDNAPNIMEFALMTNPQNGTPVPSPSAGITTVGADRFLTLSFPVRKLTGSGFVYTVESHNDLTGTWTQVWKSTDGFSHAQVVSSTPQADRTNVTIRDTSPVTAGSEHFLRLRVTDTP